MKLSGESASFKLVKGWYVGLGVLQSRLEDGPPPKDAKHQCQKDGQ